MLSTFTSSSTEAERREPGIGGKPPLDRRPIGGNGGGDDDPNNPEHGPQEALHKVRAFVFCALAGDMMFFAILVLFFFARQSSTHFDIRSREIITDWQPILLPPVLYLNTAILLLSSLSMEIARRHIFHEIDALEEWLGLGRPALHRTLPWLAGTLLLGGTFLAGQWLAWRQLTQQGFSFNQWSTPADYFFYLITGLHATHLFFGLLALFLCLTLLGRLKKIESRQIAVDALTWFWHAMGLIWLTLLAVLVLGQQG